MSSPNNIKLDNNIYLRRIVGTNANNSVYGLYGKVESFKYLGEWLTLRISKHLDFSKTYFVKESTIPRAKFREYGKNQNWKIVRNLDDASSIVIPANYFYINSYWTASSLIYLDSALALDLLNANSSFRLHIAKTEYQFVQANILDNINNGAIEKQVNSNFHEGSILALNLRINYQDRYKFFLEWETLKSENNFKIYDSPVGFIDEEKIDLFLNYANKLVYDSSLAEVLSDSVIGPDEWKSITAMMDSNQKDNINLVLALVTQSNYSQSLLYLATFLFLYNEVVYYYPCYNLKDYKSLRAYFSNYGDVRRWSIATLAHIIKDNLHLMDENFRSIIDNVMLDFVNQKMSYYKDYISISNVKFKYD